MMFSFSMQLLSIAPQYTTFGSQKQSNGNNCGLKENSNTQELKKFQCEMTSISAIYHKMILSMPMFSLACFILSWAFIAFFIFFLVHQTTKKTEKNYSLSVLFSL
jgi:hypothetical protein